MKNSKLPLSVTALVNNRKIEENANNESIIKSLIFIFMPMNEWEDCNSFVNVSEE